MVLKNSKLLRCCERVFVSYIQYGSNVFKLFHSAGMICYALRQVFQVHIKTSPVCRGTGHVNEALIQASCLAAARLTKKKNMNARHHGFLQGLMVSYNILYLYIYIYHISYIIQYIIYIYIERERE